MSHEQQIQLFEDRKVRTVWDSEQEKWYFSIVDVIQVLTDSASPAAYWRKLKQRLKEEGNEKMSKSLDNYIGIDESPEIMYEKAMKIPDDCLLEYFKLTTDVELEDAKQWITDDIVLAHRKYAEEIIKMYHGENRIKEAEERY